MPECTLTKKIYEQMDLSCDEDDRRFCSMANCDCACLQIDSVFVDARDTHLSNRDHYFLTVCRDEDAVKIGHLSDFDISSSRHWLIRKLRTLNIPGLFAFGALDIELQDYLDAGHKRNSRWLPHYHILMCADISDAEIKKTIYSAFNAGRTKRIALLKPVLDRPFSCGYLTKRPSQFKKKLASCEQGQKKAQFKIKGKARSELHGFLEQNNRLDWLLFVGCRRYGDKIVPLNRAADVINDRR